MVVCKLTEKKYNTNLNIRIDKGLKQKFIEATESQDIKYSQAIRSFIIEYVDKFGVD